MAVGRRDALRVRRGRTPESPITLRAGDAAPGRDAIDAALAAAFPGQAPRHWATDHLPDAGIHGVTAYREDDAWCFVTYGLTELFAKRGHDHGRSGWGFELTLRTQSEGAEPPDWPIRLLNLLGTHVFENRDPFAVGHRMQLGAPITGGGPPTDRTAVAFAADPVLGGLSTPNGPMIFLTAIGITAAELVEMQHSSTAAVLDRIRPSNPRLVTSLGAACRRCGRRMDLHDRHVRLKLPDAVLAVPEAERAERTWTSGALMEVQGVGAFVRVLLPIHLGEGHTLTVGTWLTIDPQRLREIWDAWETDGYTALVLDGFLANAIAPWGSSLLGAAATARPRLQDEIPYLDSSSHPLLARVLHEEWPHGDILDPYKSVL